MASRKKKDYHHLARTPQAIRQRRWRRRRAQGVVGMGLVDPITIYVPTGVRELMERIALYEDRTLSSVARNLILLGLQVYDALAEHLKTPGFDTDAPATPAPPAAVYMLDDAIRDTIMAPLLQHLSKSQPAQIYREHDHAHSEPPPKSSPQWP